MTEPSEKAKESRTKAGWRIVEDELCVECPDCLFIMSAQHVDAEKGHGYSCPNCAEHAFEAESQGEVVAEGYVLKQIVDCSEHACLTGDEDYWETTGSNTIKLYRRPDDFPEKWVRVRLTRAEGGE